MQQRTAYFSVQQQIFGAAFYRFDALAGQKFADFCWNGPAQVGSAQGYAEHAAADQIGRNAAASGFDFWQFRQSGVRYSMQLGYGGRGRARHIA